MKTLTKIFVAVVALVMAFSCVTDTTVDQTVEFGNEANGVVKTVLSVGIADSEELRTHLGDAVNGRYPMYWSEDDKISVNGVESNALEFDEATANVADFTFGQNLSTPYCVTYPAAAEGQVKFAANQSHSSNTSFGDNVATMWGYSENGEGVSLKHLTGVLKIGVVAPVGVEVMPELAYAQVSTAGRTPIAGDFEFDFVNGVLGEPAQGASEFINYNFGEDGVVLSTTEPTYLHLVVPAGMYDELYVTLFDKVGGVMCATIKAGDKKPLVAGAVREFKKDGVEQLIPYAPTTSVFVVDSVDKLYELAEGGVDKDVLFVKDIDMADDEQGRTWVPIENYAGKVLGNGHSIKGLTAPLFGVTTASIKGLHLKDVVLASNEKAIVAGLACQVLATDTTQPVIEHCSVSGTLTVNNTSYAPATANNNTGLVYAGVVGYAKGAIIDNCVNNVAITVAQTVNSATTIEHILHLAGVVSVINLHKKADNEILYSNVSNCTNNGAIYAEDVAFANADSGLCAPRIAGIISFSYDANAATVSNCTNNAPITVKNLKSHTIKTAMVGGVISYATAIKASNLTSTKVAKITIEGGIGNNLYAAPVSSYCQWSEWSDIKNYADIEVSAAMTNNLFVAGLLACTGNNNTTDHYYADNLLNEGKVTVNGYGKTTYVAGVIGRGSQGDISDSINKGEVTFTPNASTNSVTIELGGFEAVGIGDADAGKLDNCKNTAPVKLDITGCSAVAATRMAGLSAYCHHFIKDCENTGTVLVTGSGSLSTNNDITDNTTDSHYNIGGLAGYKAADTGGVADSENRGSIIYEATLAAVEGKVPCIQIGGLVGRTHQPILNTAVNHGDVIVRGDTSVSGALLCVAGTVGMVHGADKDGLTNAGNIYVSGNHTTLYLGGCAGMNSPYSLSAIKNATNSGNIYVGYNEEGEKVTATFSAATRIAGCIGNSDKYFTNIKNSGDVKVNAQFTAGNPYIAGCVAVANTKDLGGVCTKLENSGDILYEGSGYTSGGNFNMAGCIGYLYGNTKTNTHITNYGDVTFKPSAVTTGKVYLGGAANYLQSKVTDVTNNGKISMLANNNGSVYIGGAFSNPNGYNRTRVVNNGEIYIDAKVTTDDLFIGGLSYELMNGNGMVWDDCHNTGNITLTKNCEVKRTLSVGGLIAKYSTANENKVFKNCSNSGNITSYAKGCGSGCFAGLIGYFGSQTACIVIEESFVNNGKITYAGTTDGKDDIYVGGVMGYGYKFSYSKSDGTIKAWTGKVVNNGNFTISGETKGGSMRIGGLFGTLAGELGDGAELYNNGDITVTGTTNGGTESIGGIAGKNNGFVVANATVNCNITAIGHTGIGMVIGMERTDTVKATNCSVAGTIDKGKNGPHYDPTEDATVDSGWYSFVETLYTTTFHKYIYSEPVDASVAANDGCTCPTPEPTPEPEPTPAE